MRCALRARPFKDPQNLNQVLLYLLLLVLVGTLGATSIFRPNDKLSYAAFVMLAAVWALGIIRRRRTGTAEDVRLQPYDLIPFVLVLVWVYGVVLGFAYHNRTENVIRNFAGMALYSTYYIFLVNRIRKFDVLRCVLMAAGVNASYMYGFFGWDKVISPIVNHPTYFRFFEVRSYYSETLILLAVPIGLIVRKLWFPPEGLAAVAGRRRDVHAIALLSVYLFAFLSISLSKATLLAFGLAVLASIVFLGHRLFPSLRTHRLVSLAALTAVLVVTIYPASLLLGDYVPDYVSRSLPTIDWSAATRVFVRQPPEPSVKRPSATDAVAAANVRRFADAVANSLGPRDRVLIHQANVSAFEDQIGGRLIYRGAPDAANVTEAEWTKLERGTPAEVNAILAKLGVHHLLIQTAQPRMHVMDLCAHGAPLRRSAPVPVAEVSYAFELYGIDACCPPPPSAASAGVLSSTEIRRNASAAITEDLHLFGKGLGAGLTSGYQRDPSGYGFEQNYLNLVHKFGVFSVLIFLAYGYIAYRIVGALKRPRTRCFGFASMAFFVGLIMGYGNPILMSPVMVTLQCAILYWLRPDEEGSAGHVRAKGHLPQVQPRSR